MPEQITSDNQQLQLAVNELKVLNDIATTISSIQSVDDIIDQIVIKCIKHLQVEEGMVSLLEKNSEDQQFHTMIRRQGSSVSKIPNKLDNRLTGWMLKNRSIFLSNNIEKDERLHFLDDSSYSFKSILCVPLTVKADLIGYLAVFNKKDNAPFSNQDRRLLSIMGSQSAQVIENARLYEEEKALQSLQEEMNFAREIQLKLLPDSTPDVSGFEISATNISAKSVGGDYYDFISLHDKKLGFCIGDITGKGMPAAILMSNLQATFRSHALIFEDCCDCLKGTNKLLFKSTEPTKFATFFYGILDPHTGTIEYANGGHDAPLLFGSDNEAVPLNATGLLLGVMEESEYTKDSILLQQGDILFLYTDGITEAMNPEGVELGLEKIIHLITDNRDKSVHEISGIILSEVKQHENHASQSDDITLMLIKRLA